MRMRFGAGLGGVLALAMSLFGCGLDEVGDIPGYVGPAVLALDMKLTVSPDILTADGRSTAVVRAEVFGPDGLPRAGVDIAFALADESGNFADLGKLSHDRAVTDGAGLAQLVYTAPPRTDATANQTILIVARPVGNDANGAVYRSVRLELRSAEPRLFPQVPGNAAPICNYAIEAPDGFRVGRSILFQSTSSDEDGTIVRYFWDFGDGGRDDKPDVNHVYGFAGTFSVTHVVTDDDGGQSACAASLTIF
ncbi:MAG: PKD domain-containing protein [Acidobacteria bacterium]|nr:PKD domain-containing protein [Acidobacteriota bacterium]